ncbi:MAG: hypothetical protein N3E38_02895 [Candidatus Aenigmarchaeota archaeon]|nr:hypothetical protein [Candidatus Aenigmarchaeota archaeon]
MWQIVLGVILIFVGLFFATKIIGDIFKILILFLLFFAGFYLIFGQIPYSDKFGLKNIFSISIESWGRDKDGNLILVVKNRGFSEAKNLSVRVDGNEVKILNGVSSIKSRKSEILQLEWDKNFDIIVLSSNRGEAKLLNK